VSAPETLSASIVGASALMRAEELRAVRAPLKERGIWPAQHVRETAWRPAHTPNRLRDERYGFTKQDVLRGSQSRCFKRSAEVGFKYVYRTTFQVRYFLNAERLFEY
jgi:hypothetical protein